MTAAAAAGITNLDPSIITNIGATDIRSAFPAAATPAIMSAYMDGINLALLMAIPAVGAALIVACCGSWRRLNTEALTGGAA
jgi:hypothetical protein